MEEREQLNISIPNNIERDERRMQHSWRNVFVFSRFSPRLLSPSQSTPFIAVGIIQIWNRIDFNKRVIVLFLDSSKISELITLQVCKFCDWKMLWWNIQISWTNFKRSRSLHSTKQDFSHCSHWVGALIFQTLIFSTLETLLRRRNAKWIYRKVLFLYRQELCICRTSGLHYKLWELQDRSMRLLCCSSASAARKDESARGIFALLLTV